MLTTTQYVRMYTNGQIVRHEAVFFPLSVDFWPSSSIIRNIIFPPNRIAQRWRMTNGSDVGRDDNKKPVDQERLFAVLPQLNDLLRQVPAALSASKTDVPRKAWPAFAVQILMSYLPRLFEKYTRCSVDATFKFLCPTNPNVFIVRHGP